MSTAPGRIMGKIGLFATALSFGIAFSFFFWVLYIALEPYVRRRWPATLVSWNRLLVGGFRDPLVDRDALVGCLLAAFSVALARLGWFLPSWLGYAPPQPSSGSQWQFLGAGALGHNPVVKYNRILCVSQFSNLKRIR